LGRFSMFYCSVCKESKPRGRGVRGLATVAALALWAWLASRMVAGVLGG